MLFCVHTLLAAHANNTTTAFSFPSHSKISANTHFDAFRTSFHFQPAAQPPGKYTVMNDPNGLMFDPKTALYHLFAQYHHTNSSFANANDGTVWYHAVSKDMLRWTHLPPALKPDAPYDCDGIFTGSATLVGSPPRPILAYSVKCNKAIALAVPADGDDERLVNWTKPAFNPIAQSPSHRAYNFRDPTTAWKPDNSAEWRMAVGCSGHLCTFRSSDFVHWRDAGIFYKVPRQYMWECPDVFQIAPDRWVIKVSSAPYDEYCVGTFTAGVNDTFQKVAGAEDIGEAISNGQLIDSGNVYASKTFYDPVHQRRVLFGWVHEEPGFPPSQQWQGVMTTPR